MTDTVPEISDVRIEPLPRFCRSERAELRAKSHAVALYSQHVAELGHKWMDAEARYKAHPTDENYDARIAAMNAYRAAKKADPTVDTYLKTEHKMIARARAREACEARVATAHRPTCRAGQRRAPRQRSQRARPRRATATADPDPESADPRRLSSEVPR